MKLIDVSVSFPGRKEPLGPWTVEGPDNIPWLILGPSGSGKTTFLRAIAGRLAFRGRMEGAPPRDSTVFVPQFPERVLCGRNLAEDLGATLTPGAVQRRNLRAFLKSCALEIPLNRESRSLSGGEKRRLLMAMISRSGWPNWGWDEPEAGLDVSGRQLLLEWMEKDFIQSSGQHWIVTSRPWMYFGLNPFCVVLQKGRIVFAGLRDAALAREENWNLLGLDAHPAGKAWKDIAKRFHNLENNVWKKLSFEHASIAQMQAILRDSEVRS